MPELSPGASLSFATTATTTTTNNSDCRLRIRNRSRRSLRYDDNNNVNNRDDNNFNDNIVGCRCTSVANNTFSVAGVPAETTAKNRRPFVVVVSRRRRRSRRRRVIDSDDAVRLRNDNVEKPTDCRRTTVFRQTLRGGANGPRLHVDILLYAVPEFADR